MDRTLIRCLLLFNDRIDRFCPGDLCDSRLLDFLDALYALELGPCGNKVVACFWLTAARMAELALWFAGDKADSAVVSVAGWLLGESMDVGIEPGHGERTAASGGEGRSIQSAARTLAFLSELRCHLEACGMLAAGYLAGLDQRIGRVEAALDFVAKWAVRSGGDLGRRSTVPVMCCFQGDAFRRIGEDLRRIVAREGEWSEFLTVAQRESAADFFCGSLCQ